VDRDTVKTQMTARLGTAPVGRLFVSADYRPIGVLFDAAVDFRSDMIMDWHRSSEASKRLWS
jgi:hypothetical protein